MKIAFVLHWNQGPGGGVQKKVWAQIAAWRAEGHEVRRYLICRQDRAELLASDDQQMFTYRNTRERIGVWSRVARTLDGWVPDVIYHRYDLFAPGLRAIARRFPLVLEINSDDVEEYASDGRARAVYNRLTRRLLLSDARGLVFVTRELARSPRFTAAGRPRRVIANGIRLADFRPLPPARTPPTSLVFLGSPGLVWHGVDKLLLLARALPDWHLHLIGITADQLGEPVPGNVTPHGHLTPAQYRPLLAGATAAVGTLALHRKAMHEASPLKVREYLACGLPVILGHEDTDFPGGADFLLQLPNVEDNILPHLGAIRQFVERWRGQRVPQTRVSPIDSLAKERERLAFLLECL